MYLIANSLMIVFYSGFVKGRHWDLKFVQKYDGKRRMATPHGCFWSSRRVCTGMVHI